MIKAPSIPRTFSLTVLTAAAFCFGEQTPAIAQTFAFQDSSNYLKIYADGTVLDPDIYAQPGTVPTSAYSQGKMAFGFRGQNGDYWQNGPEEVGYFWTYDSGGWMAAGTSPGISFLSDQVAFAFQAPNGQLWVSMGGLKNGHPTGAYMSSGTSPSIAGLPNGNLAMAFRGSNGHFWVSMQAPGNGQDTGGYIQPGTSPSIAALPNSQIAYAFQGAWQGYEALWVGAGNGVGGYPIDWNLPAISPSVVADASGGALVAYSDQYGTAAFYVSTNPSDSNNYAVYSTGCSIAPSASPIALSLNNPNRDYETFSYVIALKGPNGDLWLATAGHCSDTGVQMN